MAALAPGDTAADGLLALNQATDVAEAGRAAAMISAPVQNMLVADASGIGLFVTGRVPIRRAGDGAAPVDGASGKFDWTGFASGDALPHYVDPPSGRLVNANERVAPRDFPVFMGRDWFGDWRARAHPPASRSGRQQAHAGRFRADAGRCRPAPSPRRCCRCCAASPCRRRRRPRRRRRCSRTGTGGWRWTCRSR